MDNYPNPTYSEQAGCNGINSIFQFTPMALDQAYDGYWSLISNFNSKRYAMKGPKIPSSHGRTHIGALFLGGIFDDGGGIIISPTKYGGLVLAHIPPREPVTNEFMPVESVLVDAKVSAAQICEHFKISASSGQAVEDGIAALGGIQPG
ncbi:hypothetical protein PQR65_36965 [Paraburkholderia nemoris]|uniref:hypothetical protein n=1 Tax=Paraburkholderia nemoris TaxID=2793076 RepID=UPI0038BCD0DE